MTVSVGLICIIMIPITFITWLVTYTPVAMMIDILRTMTADPNAMRIFSMANISCSLLLVGEIVVLLVWWLASSFQSEDQTFQVGAGY